jgi:hypothetical protein
VSPAEKKEIDNQVKELREAEGRLKNQLDYQLKQLDSLPRSGETAQRRIALDKLSKDFQKIKTIVQTVYTDVNMVSVSENGARGGSARNTGDNNSDTRSAEPLSAGLGKNQQMQMQMQEPALQMLGESVDEAIALEREREIRQMNQDLLLVNEMMRWIYYLQLLNFVFHT